MTASRATEKIFLVGGNLIKGKNILIKTNKHLSQLAFNSYIIIALVRG